jgi:hypothetical protein
MVPVILLELSSEDQAGYAIAHNRTVELGGYNVARVVENIRQMNPKTLPGWSQQELDTIKKIATDTVQRATLEMMERGEQTGFHGLVRLRISPETLRRFRDWQKSRGLSSEDAFSTLVFEVYVQMRDRSC